MWNFWVDRGGTFTDIIAISPENQVIKQKILSSSPDKYSDAASFAIRNILGLEKNQPIPAGLVDEIRLGTTVCTNALLERKGVPVVFVTTFGHKDVLAIRYQSRSDIFALNIKKTIPLTECIVEANERIDARGEIIKPLDEVGVYRQLEYFKNQGVDSCAICLMNSYKNPGHELIIERIARQLGFSFVATSHRVSNLQEFVARCETTVLEGYLNPIIRSYIDTFHRELKDAKSIPIKFMQSQGGLCWDHEFSGKNSILSGPAGGVIGAIDVARRANLSKIIAFDMGGTSTDVSHYDGQVKYGFDNEVSGISIRSPMVQIHTVAAGGGSIVQFHQGRLAVGPTSAGAYPGPLCYGFGGPLTITDCNLVLGRLFIDSFPKVFGEFGNQGLDYATTKQEFDLLAQSIDSSLSMEELAQKFIELAVFDMSNAIRRITIERGISVEGHSLVCMGSATGQLACLVAEELGIDSIIIHPLAGLLSAYGIGMGEQIYSSSKSINCLLATMNQESLDIEIDELKRHLRKKHLDSEQGPHQWNVVIHLQQGRSQESISITSDSISGLSEKFKIAFHKEHGFLPVGDDVAIGFISVNLHLPGAESKNLSFGDNDLEIPSQTKQIYLKGQWVEVKVVPRKDIPLEATAGPLMVVDETSTNIIEGGWAVKKDKNNCLLVQKYEDSTSQDLSSSNQPKGFELELMGNFYNQVAERMGAVLKKSSRSVNIRERLDFSCAIFDGKGHLIANAPHIPVHLGSMGSCVQDLIADKGREWARGDVYLHNDPYHGGTHLPDLTVISPLFIDGREKPIAFLASRGHHADIGGISPGSMPAFSTHIEEEGVLFRNFLLVRDKIINEDSLRQTLQKSTYPSRKVEENVADLRAQIAANQSGISDMLGGIERWGLTTILRLMDELQDNAETVLSQKLPGFKLGKSIVESDNGLRICCQIEVDQATNKLSFDFRGSSKSRDDNFNAPFAVVRAAVLYCLRCIIGEKIPLNDGLLRGVLIKVDDDSLLNPQYPTAVVAGNVEVSQLVVDAILSALGITAHSQGTMNNFSFGNDLLQYYETIGGGAGAGDSYNGASGVQTHMTNSRITDPEILESHFPVILREFSLRKDSGGRGRFSGGDGLVREVEFLEDMQVNIISGRRTTKPHGLEGGKMGQSGVQKLILKDGVEILMKSCQGIDVPRGSKVRIETPGGGGFGEAGKLPKGN